MAYKRELIVNNGSLTSYKKLLKVSDVCQLLNKSEYVATTTVNGVTYTNNSDGSFTVNGTATARAVFIFKTGLNIPNGKFLFLGKNESLALQMDVYIDGVYTATRFANNIFVSNYSGDFNGVVYFVVDAGQTVNNLTSKPQLFDLTEMYGAGNEPSTVAEFKQKFPEELYDYSPRCWVKSYKTGLIAETKNLFDSNNINKSHLGITHKTVSNGKILLNGTKEAGYNIYAVTTPNITLPAGTYTLSCRMLAGNIEGYDITFNRWIYFGINNSSSTYRCGGVGKVGDYETQTFTLTEDTLLSSFDITAGYTSGFSIDNVMIECQLEKGTTATDYVPYGYL